MIIVPNGVFSSDSLKSLNMTNIMQQYLTTKEKYNIVQSCGGLRGLEYYLSIIENPPKELPKHDANMLKRFEEFDMTQTQERLKSIFEMC